LNGSKGVEMGLDLLRGDLCAALREINCRKRQRISELVRDAAKSRMFPWFRSPRARHGYISDSTRFCTEGIPMDRQTLYILFWLFCMAILVVAMFYVLID
jgi:hypothetical protein